MNKKNELNNIFASEKSFIRNKISRGKKNSLWNLYTDQACNRPRGQRLSESCDPIEGPNEPLVHHGHMLPRGLRGSLKRFQIRPRGLRLSEAKKENSSQ